MTMTLRSVERGVGRSMGTTGRYAGAISGVHEGSELADYVPAQPVRRCAGGDRRRIVSEPVREANQGVGEMKIAHGMRTDTGTDFRDEGAR
jgi:hypothetical protein